MYQKLNRVECDPACGFMVQSHDEQEVLDMTLDHIRNKHHLDTSEEDIKARIMVV